MTEEELQKKKKNYIGILTNTHFSTLRNKIIYSLGGDENSKIMTDLFIYLLHINKQQWDEHRLQMTEYDGYFLQTCSQIEHNNFLSPHHRRLGMDGLKDRGLIDFKLTGREKTYKIKVYVEKMIELVEMSVNDFNDFLDDFRETERKRYEEKRDRQIETKERWETINRLKYRDPITFREKMLEYGYDDFDTQLITYISKGMWKHKHRMIEWTEQDLNHIRSLVCEGNRDGKTKEEQEEKFKLLGGNFQRIVDTCKMDDKKYKGMKSWSVVYGYLYVGNSYDEEGKPYRYNYDWKIDDLDYYKGDISSQISNLTL